MPRGNAVSLPFEPLYRITGAKNANEFAALVDVSPSGIRNAISRDRISWIFADRLACRLGFHPFAVWQDAWLGAIEEVGRRHRDMMNRSRANYLAKIRVA